ncbi:MAG: hypothetical protein WCH86_08550 [Kiritimatiellales bacterium]
MITRIKKSISRYFNSRLIPAGVTLLLLGTFAITIAVCFRKPVDILLGILSLLLGLSLLGILSASIWNFIKKRWAKGTVNLLSFLLCSVIVGIIGGGSLIFYSMFGPSEDGFGKDIVIPPDMNVESPLNPRTSTNSPAIDTEGDALVASIFTTNGNREISVELPVLNEFSGPKKDLLLRHLASSAKWAVTKDRGKVYAYRRCVVDGLWQSSLNGFHSDFKDHQFFQFRMIIGPNGPVMSQPRQAQATEANISDRAVQLTAKESNQDVESYLVLKSKGAALEIFEESPNHDRPFTPLALKQINDELQSVLSSPVAEQRGFDPALMPPESIKSGDPDIQLANGMQGGIYLVYAYVNPGEPGCAYLKVFEATKNTPLSAHRMPEPSTEYIGWSDNPNEQFFYNSEITVYEGDWEVYYPARFELWFVPDSGKPERKLIEKIFRIEGWQR